jgi:hypothetical protein
MSAIDLPEYRPVYRSIHRPLTVAGVERRLFFLALLVGAAAFNLFRSFTAGSSSSACSTAWRGGAMLTIRSSSAFCFGRAVPGHGTTPQSVGTDQDDAMMRLQQIQRPYHDAGAVNTLIALWGFVDATTFLTKAGAVG